MACAAGTSRLPARHSRHARRSCSRIGAARRDASTRDDAEPVRRQAAPLNFGTRIAEFFASLSPRTLAWSAGAAAVAILLQAGLLAGIMLNETKTSGYQTASAPTTDPGVGAFTLIRFAPQASSDDITRFLEANKLSIAAGPMAGGLYKVRVAVTGIPKAELARIVKKLQEDKVVSFIATTSLTPARTSARTLVLRRS